MPRSIRVLLIVLAIAAAFLFGLYSGGHYYRIAPLVNILPHPVRAALFPGSDTLQLENEIEGILEQNYYQPVSADSLGDGAIDGMIKSVNDPYTAYLAPSDYQSFEQHTEGTYVGVGITIESKDNKLTIVSVLDSSPAQSAGIEAGDQILAVDGQDLAGKTSEEASTLLHGDEGSSVTLHVLRGQSEMDFTMVRQSLQLPVVTDRMIDHNGRKIGYVRLEQFSEGAGDKVKESVTRLVNDGAQGIIFDLRDNGGGLLDEGVNVASDFIQDGNIVSVVSRDGSRQTYEARGDANETVPLTVLVNGYTASASEIVAGAIKDDGRGKLIGEKTFGKGVVQNIAVLSNGGALKFTSGSYYTPNDIDINKIGIQPDIPVTVDPNAPNDQVLDTALAQLAP